ncbi:MAG: hypothetical protein N2A40_00680, partial [Desulfobulbaceae bacterium]
MLVELTASYAAFKKQQSLPLFLGVASGSLHQLVIIWQPTSADDPRRKGISVLSDNDQNPTIKLR